MKVYKLVRKGKDGNCYPLFIDKNKPFVFGAEMPCEYHPTKGFAVRSVDENPTGGWHCCFTPYAAHLNEKLASGEERVWIECEGSGKTKTYKRSLHQGGDWILVETIKPLRVMPWDEVRKMQKEFCEKHGIDGDPYWVVLSGTEGGKEVNKTIKVAAPDHSKAVDRAMEVWEPDTLETAEVYSDEMLDNKVYTLEF